MSSFLSADGVQARNWVARSAEVRTLSGLVLFIAYGLFEKAS
jgi:hypothetical protein